MNTAITSEEDSTWSIPECNTYQVRGWTPIVLQMNSFAFSNSLRACNGQFPSDNPANPTYNKLGQSSIIDYILVDVELWHRIADFVVTPRCKSDHNPLVLEVVFLKPEHNQNFSAHSASNLIATEGGRRVRWGTFVQSIEKVANLYEQIIPHLELAFQVSTNELFRIFTGNRQEP